LGGRSKNGGELVGGGKKKVDKVEQGASYNQKVLNRNLDNGHRVGVAGNKRRGKL